MLDNHDESYIARFITDPPATFYDLGVGHKTEWSVLHTRWPAMRIFGCEPCPSNIKQLAGRFPGTLYPVAIAERPGTLPMFVHPTNDGGHSLYRSGRNMINVPAWTLDQFDAAAGHPERILLWMDIEGGELCAMRGAPLLLASGRVRWLTIEVRTDGWLRLHSAFIANHPGGWPTQDAIDAVLAPYRYRRVAAYNHCPGSHYDAIYVHADEPLPEGIRPDTEYPSE